MAYGGRRYQPSAQAEEITSMRKSGQLKDAYDKARLYYSKGLREETFMSAYTWVFYDCLKRYFETGRFCNDIKAYCSVLAKIRQFPINPDRDELFIDNLQKHVYKVGWGLRDKKLDADIRILCSEICQWKQGSSLYTPDIARMLLVSAKSCNVDTVPVIQWLGLPSVPWLEIRSGQHQIKKGDGVAANAISWAFYDDLKQYVGNEQGGKANIPQFVQTLADMRLTIPKSFSRHEAVIYAVGQLVHIGWECRERKYIDGVEQLLTEAMQWSQTSAMHTQDVLTMFRVALRDRPACIVNLIDWYGLDCLKADDFKQRKYEGKPQPSIAQEVVGTYLKALLANDSNGNPVASAQQKSHGCDQVSSLLKDEKCAEWIWEPYYLGKLLTDIGRFEEARQQLAPIVVMKQSEPWSWHAYALTWEKTSPENYEKCLFMGLCRSNNPRLAKSLHETAALLFANKGQFVNAKTEVQILKKIAIENGWQESPIVASLESEQWFAGTEPGSNNAGLYNELSAGAEDIVAQDLPWSEFYVDKAFPDTGIIYIVSEAPTKTSYVSTTVKSKKIAAVVQNGSCYRGHFDAEHKSLIGRIEEYPEAQIAEQFVSSYSGQIELIDNYGFVNYSYRQVWISPALLEGKPVKPFQLVSGKCRKTYRVSKESLSSGRWAWEAMTIELGVEADPSTYKREGSGIFNYATRFQIKQGFGFVKSPGHEDYYVSASIAKKYNLLDGQSIDYIAKRSWDSKKGRWGWRIAEITGKGAVERSNHDDYDDYDCYDSNDYLNDDHYLYDGSDIDEKYKHIIEKLEIEANELQGGPDI